MSCIKHSAVAQARDLPENLLRLEPQTLSLHGVMAPAGNGKTPQARRRKIPLACEPCRERKSRCDGDKPICARCRARGLDLDQCIYKIENARTADNAGYIAALHQRIRHLESAREVTTSTAMQPSTSTRCDQSSMLEIDDSHLASASDMTNAAPAAANTPTAPPHNNLELPTTSNEMDFSPLAAMAGQSREGLTSQVGDVAPVPSAPSREQESQPTNDSTALRMTPRSQDEKNTMTQNTSGPSAFDGEHHDVTGMGTVSSEDTMRDDPDKQGQFYGNSAAASFIREAYGRDIGVLGGSTRSAPNHRQLRPETTSKYRDSAMFVLPTRALADHLVDKYLERVFYLYPVLHWPSFHKAYTTLWDSATASQGQDPTDQTDDHVGLGSADAGPQSAVFHCALNAIFSLSCHFSDLDPPERSSTSSMFFQRSKTLLGLEFLESDTLSVIQVLIILALTLQGTSFPTRCWNSVGIACRLAQGLGLHAENRDSATTALETEIRRRVWHCCVVMDMTVSMTFGRPPMTTHASNVHLASAIDEGEKLGALTLDNAADNISKMSYLNSSVKLSAILENILCRIYNPWRDQNSRNDHPPELFHNNYDAIIELDSQLANFESSVPGPLSWTATMQSEQPTTTQPLIQMQRNVLQGRFLYVRLMLFRPALSSLCSGRAHQRGVSPVGTTGHRISKETAGLRSSLQVECGKSCVTCAMSLLDLTQTNLESQCTTAWWWNALYASTSGFVLVLALSCSTLRARLDIPSVQNAWEVCRLILRHLAEIHPMVQKSIELLDRLHSRYFVTIDEPGAVFPDEGSQPLASFNDIRHSSLFNDEPMGNIMGMELRDDSELAGTPMNAFTMNSFLGL